VQARRQLPCGAGSERRHRAEQRGIGRGRQRGAARARWRVQLFCRQSASDIWHGVSLVSADRIGLARRNPSLTTQDRSMSRAMPPMASKVTRRVRPFGALQTEGTQTRYAVDPFSLGLWLSFAHQPLVAVNNQGDVVEKIVGAQLGLDLITAYAFSDHIELGLHAPLAYVAGENLAAAALGDMRLLPKFTLLRDDRAGVGLGILGELRLPTHTDQFTGGARNLAGGAKFLLDHRFGLSGLRLGLQLGVLLREIGGHTDNTGPREFNMQLSRARARSVRQ
jgi:hypothetical protein